MTAPRVIVVAALCLAVTLPTSSRAAMDATVEPTNAILEALRYVDPDVVISVEVVDWAGLRARHGGEDVTSASPLHEREALLAEMARAGPTTIPIGLDLLATWPAAWGFDSTDLLWQASLWTGEPRPTTTILRFRGDWDATPFELALARHGFVRVEALEGAAGDLITYSPGPAAWSLPGEELERLLGFADGLPTTPSVGLTLAEGRRTVIVESGGDGRAAAELAQRPEAPPPEESPFGRVALAMGQPLSARLVAGRAICSGSGRENGPLRGRELRLAASVGPLRPYVALGAGFDPGAADEGSTGRVVFAYPRARAAARDLAGRRVLLEAEKGMAVASTIAAGRELAIDVTTEVAPAARLDELGGSGELYAMCGPLPDDEPLPRVAGADVPLFAGPATLVLSGERGRHRFDEVHFGADEVRVRTSVEAGLDPCAVWLELMDDAAGSGRQLSSDALGAAPGDSEAVSTAWRVDYASASLRVASTCPAWSLRLVPLEDPELPYTLEERFYPVRGVSIAELVPQTQHVKDRWAAFARWHATWRYSLEASAAACEVTEGSAALQADIIYPRWGRPAGADQDTVSRWDRFVRNLTTHELGHITIALQGADAVAELLEGGISAETCEEAARTADRAAARLYERSNRRNARYDEETGHGAAQGTSLH
jgi:predicted secreted Zn-dependent protease